MDRPGLSPDARSIVDAARDAEDPSPEHLAHVRGRVFAHLGVGLAAGTAATLAATTTAEAAGATATAATGAASTLATGAATTAGLGFFAKMTLATQITITVLALGGAATGVAVATRGSTRDAAHASSAPMAVPATPASATATTGEPAAAPPLEASRADVAPLPPATVEPMTPPASTDAAASAPARAVATPPPPPAAPSAPAVDPLAAETELLGRAQAALAAGRHADALVLLDEHARLFPRGALAHEREGARWLASCGAGRGDAVRSAVGAFLAEHPSSPLAARLRAACGFDR